MPFLSRAMPSLRLLVFVPKTAASACPKTPTTHFQQLLRARLSTLRTLRSPRRSFATAAPNPPPPRRPQTSISLAQQLANKGTPTHLYEAPPHTWFRVGCISTGVFFISYAMLQYWAVYPKRTELSTWVMPAYGLICCAMSAAGTYFILGSSRIVRVIRALPARSVTPRMLTGGGKTEAEKMATIASNPLFMEVEIGQMLPVLPVRKLVVVPEEVVFPYRLEKFGLGQVGPDVAPPMNERDKVKARIAEREAARKQAQFDKEHLMTIPFRHGARAATTVWGSLKRALTHEGFLPMMVGGVKYKIDVMGGWVLENGRVLDRLATIRNRD